MDEMIHIGKPYLEKREGAHSVRLCADLSVAQKHVYTMWFEADEKYAPYLCYERSDAFVVVLLLYAMEHGRNITCEQEISERLSYQLTEYLIPSISANIRRYQQIALHAPVSNEPLPCEGAVGSALSGGVDSFYTLMRHLHRGDHHDITHFVFFNEGSCGEFGGESARAMYHDRINWISDVAVRLGKEMVLVDGNASEFLQQRHMPTHSFRILSNILALQKLFGIYYMASAFPFTSFRFSDEASGFYDLLTVHCLSTETTSFYLSGGEVTRLEKVAAIADWPLTYSRLNVCDIYATNCSKCEKCRRTMMELYCIDKLELYRDVFDLNNFYTHKNEMIDFAVGHRKEEYWDEIYHSLCDRRDVTAGVRLRFFFKRVYRKLKAVVKKVPFVYRAYCRLRHQKNKF